MTAVITYSRTQSVTYVADNIVKTLKDIIRGSGLDPSKLAGDYATYMRGIETWLQTEHLRAITLEIYNPSTGGLIRRWDIDVRYDWASGDASFWMDTEQIKFALNKAGVAPSTAKYSIILDLRPGSPDVSGWGSCSYRSTEGLVRQSLGSTIEHNGLGASASYWRAAS